LELEGLPFSIEAGDCAALYHSFIPIAFTVLPALLHLAR